MLACIHTDTRRAYPAGSGLATRLDLADHDAPGDRECLQHDVEAFTITVGPDSTDTLPGCIFLALRVFIVADHERVVRWAIFGWGWLVEISFVVVTLTSRAWRSRRKLRGAWSTQHGSTANGAGRGIDGVPASAIFHAQPRTWVTSKGDRTNIETPKRLRPTRRGSGARPDKRSRSPSFFLDGQAALCLTKSSLESTGCRPGSKSLVYKIFSVTADA